MPEHQIHIWEYELVAKDSELGYYPKNDPSTVWFLQTGTARTGAAGWYHVYIYVESGYNEATPRTLRVTVPWRLYL